MGLVFRNINFIKFCFKIGMLSYGVGYNRER